MKAENGLVVAWQQYYAAKVMIAVYSKELRSEIGIQSFNLYMEVGVQLHLSHF